MSRKLTTSLLLLTLMGSLAGCAGMSRSERNTVAGAAIGGVAGSVLTDGSALGTVGGAAIGGLIGVLWLHEGYVKYHAGFGRSDILLVVHSATAKRAR